MARPKSAVLKGKTSAAVKKADKAKQLIADIKANEREAGKLLKEIAKLAEKHSKLMVKLDKAQAPKVSQEVVIEVPVTIDTSPSTETVVELAA